MVKLVVAHDARHHDVLGEDQRLEQQSSLLLPLPGQLVQGPWSPSADFEGDWSSSVGRTTRTVGIQIAP